MAAALAACDKPNAPSRSAEFPAAADNCSVAVRECPVVPDTAAAAAIDTLRSRGHRRKSRCIAPRRATFPLQPSLPPLSSPPPPPPFLPSSQTAAVARQSPRPREAQQDCCSLSKIAETNGQAVMWLELHTLLRRLRALLLRLRATWDNSGMHGDARGNTPKALHYTSTCTMAKWRCRGSGARDGSLSLPCSSLQHSAQRCASENSKPGT